MSKLCANLYFCCRLVIDDHYQLYNCSPAVLVKVLRALPLFRAKMGQQYSYYSSNRVRNDRQPSVIFRTFCSIGHSKDVVGQEVVHV